MDKFAFVAALVATVFSVITALITRMPQKDAVKRLELLIELRKAIIQDDGTKKASNDTERGWVEEEIKSQLQAWPAAGKRHWTTNRIILGALLMVTYLMLGLILLNVWPLEPWLLLLAAPPFLLGIVLVSFNGIHALLGTKNQPNLPKWLSWL